MLLDLDGTLLDIAPTPDQVVVPPDLPGVLVRLRAAVGQALAIVTGRPIAQIDALLPDVPYAVAGEHGSTIRHAPAQPVVRAPLPAMPPALLAGAEHIAASTPGVLLERKHNGCVLHFRAVPDAGPALQAALQPLLSGQTSFALVSALMAWEVRPVGADKGTAVAALMRRPPFAGRIPIFIGDDVTDEDGMRACRGLGGIGLQVGPVFGSAQAVRDWLARITAGRLMITPTDGRYVGHRAAAPTTDDTSPTTPEDPGARSVD